MNNKNMKGFGLIEVLVALAIMAVGLLAVASLQSSLVNDSNENKLKAEAMALAQERIEQLRNYTDDGLTESDFNTIFAVGTDKNSTAIVGNNASFTRAETIADINERKSITVNVSWIDAQGVAQIVSLDTQLSWVSPSLSGDIETIKESESYVRSATGRAKLGEGQVTDDEYDSDTTIKYTNGDGTGLLDRGDGDLRLTSGKDVVLTLEDACEIVNNERTGTACTGFAEISGRIYVDQNNTSFDIKDIFVIASDAAYCQRYYIDSSTKEVKAVTNDTTKALFTESNKTFEYYEYTCYLGGGWHGNVGLLQAQSNENKTAILDGCMGDPYETDPNLTPKVAVRRVYRGMAFVEGKSGKPTEDSDGFPIYYSIGINDALILPEEGEPGHDFVITAVSNSNEQDCITAMRVSDADIDGVTGARFDGMPTDFFCLNQNSTYLDLTKIDSFGYKYDDYCPYDPSDPPLKIYELSGDITVKGIDLIEEDLLAGIFINTSDSTGNCTLAYESVADTTHTLNFSCNVFDWGDGWEGAINLSSIITDFECLDYQQNFPTGSEVFADQVINNFTCRIGAEVDPPVVEPVDVTVGGSVYGETGKLSTVTFTVTNGTSVTCDKNIYSCIATANGTPWSGVLYVNSSHKNNTPCIGIPDGIEAANYSIIRASSKGTVASISFTNITNELISLNIAITKNNEACSVYL
ncbi:prepilin-type N-terminal cleavage/methylation domain-containing protein [Thalassotalea psychrophila]|uniref:Prepilin-type N-terminal cleavage/methylation domain-containing protein n=1 Tax=Thalassotalea psychrophila TaxID=3065647 RepID=A0ABY9TX59_9GAMM|nr:prepilin-type N-terminal cleavage/methylation domain-containing protein [Colwelliaceae bacterium SQ149]